MWGGVHKDVSGEPHPVLFSHGLIGEAGRTRPEDVAESLKATNSDLPEQVETARDFPGFLT